MHIWWSHLRVPIHNAHIWRVYVQATNFNVFFRPLMTFSRVCNLCDNTRYLEHNCLIMWVDTFSVSGNVFYKRIRRRHIKVELCANFHLHMNLVERMPMNIIWLFGDIVGYGVFFKKVLMYFLGGELSNMLRAGTEEVFWQEKTENTWLWII